MSKVEVKFEIVETVCYEGRVEVDTDLWLECFGTSFVEMSGQGLSSEDVRQYVDFAGVEPVESDGDVQGQVWSGFKADF